MGWWLSLAWVQIQVWKGVFRLDWTSGHAMRFNSRTGIEGPPVSSLNCDRPLHSGLKVPDLVMDAGCRDNRWTASLCTWPPGCSPLVLLPSQGVGSAWVSLSLVGCTSTPACSRETHSPSQASKTYGHNAFQIIHMYTHHCYQQWSQNDWSRTHYSTLHTLWGCAGELASALAAAIILADAAVTPPSPKWPKNVLNGTLNLAQPTIEALHWSELCSVWFWQDFCICTVSLTIHVFVGL